MAISLISRYIAFSLLSIIFATVLPYETLDAKTPPPTLSSFSFERFEKNQSLEHGIALYGDAEMGDSAVGLGLTFFLVPASVRLVPSSVRPGILSVTYAASRGDNSSHHTGNQVEINVGGKIATKSSDLSRVNLVLNSGERLHSWIDYSGESNKVELRLSKLEGFSELREFL